MPLQLRKWLMMTGALSVLLYVLHVIAGGMLWTHYDHFHQPVSDLTATGAPGRNMLLVLTYAYGVMALVFAIAFTVLESRSHHIAVHWGGICFIILHFISIAYGLFPEDLPGTRQTFQGLMHVLITGIIVPLTILTPWFAGLGFIRESAWKRFGIFSIAAGVFILVFGGISAYLFINRLPFFGLAERINIGTLQLWTLVLSVRLSR